MHPFLLCDTRLYSCQCHFSAQGGFNLFRQRVTLTRPHVPMPLFLAAQSQANFWGRQWTHQIQRLWPMRCKRCSSWVPLFPQHALLPQAQAQCKGAHTAHITAQPATHRSVPKLSNDNNCLLGCKQWSGGSWRSTGLCCLTPCLKSLYLTQLAAPKLVSLLAPRLQSTCTVGWGLCAGL